MARVAPQVGKLRVIRAAHRSCARLFLRLRCTSDVRAKFTHGFFRGDGVDAKQLQLKQLQLALDDLAWGLRHCAGVDTGENHHELP
jgi:hypothetical protein